MIREALAGRKPTIYNTEDCKRDYIYVYDLMQYLYRMGLSKKHYAADIFNLATGKAYSAMEIAETIYKALNKPLEYDKGDPLKFWDKYEELFNARFNLKKNVSNRKYSSIVWAMVQKCDGNLNTKPRRICWMD